MNKLVIGLGLAWLARRWVITVLVVAIATIIGTCELAKEERVYEQYKTELDAMNCGKIMAQINRLNKRLSELNHYRDEGRAAHRKQKQEALDKGVTDDAIWARIDGLEKTISETYAKMLSELEADSIPRLALELAANKKGCFV